MSMKTALMVILLFMVVMVCGCKGKEAEAEVSGIDIDAPCTIDVDPNDYLIILDEDWDIPDTLTISTESGGELVLSFEGDELKITGDADMNEAAQIFFTEVLKRIVDDYIRSRIQ